MNKRIMALGLLGLSLSMAVPVTNYAKEIETDKEIVTNIEGNEVLETPVTAEEYEASGEGAKDDCEETYKLEVTDENIDKFKNCEVLSLGRKDNLNEIAKNLFETLRKCDDLGVEYILCQGFEEDGVGLAIMNRLNKAAGYDIIKV